MPVVHWHQNPLLPLLGPAGRVGVVRRAAFAAIARRSAYFLATTPALADEIRRSGVADHKIGVLPNPVAVERLLEGPPALPDTVARIVSVGRLAPQKRHDVLLSAFAIVARGRPARLTIVGAGPELGRLRAQAGELGVGERVTFTGFVTDPAPHLLAAHLFALASDYEGFGNAIVEALAAGLPVVATDAPHGPPFILEDGALGRLVPPGQPAPLAAAIEAALDAGPPSPERTAAARRRAAEFSAVTIADRFEAIVDELQARLPPGRR